MSTTASSSAAAGPMKSWACRTRWLPWVGAAAVKGAKVAANVPRAAKGNTEAVETAAADGAETAADAAEAGAETVADAAVAAVMAATGANDGDPRTSSAPGRASLDLHGEGDESLILADIELLRAAI